jgi:hypothetical protein
MTDSITPDLIAANYISRAAKLARQLPGLISIQGEDRYKAATAT